MSTTDIQITSVLIVEEEVQLTLAELCQACNAPQASIVAWVNEGVLEPSGETPDDWRFTGASLRRARKARWLTHDMEVNTQGVGIVLDLLDEIAGLQARLQRAGLD
jgi:chaperone modulatory protein CbpM